MKRREAAVSDHTNVPASVTTEAGVAVLGGGTSGSTNVAVGVTAVGVDGAVAIAATWAVVV